MDHTDQSLAPDASKVSADQAVIEPALGLGRWAPFNWERLPHSTGIRLFWGRIVLWVLVLVCVGWTLLATGLFVFVKYRRGFSDVQYSHMLFLPWKLDAYRRAKGEFLIKEGLAKAEAQEWRAAFDLLRPGLLAVPDHREARLLTARIYLMAGRPDIARTLLLDGLKTYNGDQLGYLREALGFFFGLQADEAVIDLTRELRARLDAKAPAMRMAVTALAYAYFNRERFDEAEAVLAEEHLLGTPEARFVAARISWERGRRAEAVAQLRELAVQMPSEPEAYRTLVVYLREDRRWAEVRRASLQRQFMLPEDPEAYVDFIAACAEEGDAARRAETEAAFFEHFGNNTQALLKLADSAAGAGRIETVRRVAMRCRELGRDEAESALLLLAAHVEARDYPGLLELWSDLRPRTVRWSERHRLMADGLRAVALYGTGQEVEASILTQRVAESRLLPAPLLVSIARKLLVVGQARESRRVAAQAGVIDPLYQPALVCTLEVMVADGDLAGGPALIERLLGMRKPPTDLLHSLTQALGSDQYLFLPDRAKAEAEIAGWLSERKRP